jgi:hypothetical protein
VGDDFDPFGVPEVDDLEYSNDGDADGAWG